MTNSFFGDVTPINIFNLLFLSSVETLNASGGEDCYYFILEQLQWYIRDYLQS